MAAMIPVELSSFSDEIAITSGKTDEERKQIALAFGSRPMLNVLLDFRGNVKAYRIGKFDTSKLPGVKRFTGDLLKRRLAVCEGTDKIDPCSALDDYEYNGKMLTTCRLAERPDCHRCHSEILNNQRPCPRNILPVE